MMCPKGQGEPGRDGGRPRHRATHKRAQNLDQKAAQTVTAQGATQGGDVRERVGPHGHQHASPEPNWQAMASEEAGSISAGSGEGASGEWGC